MSRVEKCDQYDNIAVNAAKIEGIREDVTYMRTKLDKLDSLANRMYGAMAVSGIAGGLVGGLGGGVVKDALSSPASADVVQSGMGDLVSMILGPLVALLGVGLYKYVMGRRKAQAYDADVHQVNKSAGVRQVRYQERKADRARRLDEAMARPPEDLDDLLDEAEALYKTDRGE